MFRHEAFIFSSHLSHTHTCVTNEPQQFLVKTVLNPLQMACSLPPLMYPVLLLTWYWSQINYGRHDGSQSHENGRSEQASPSFRQHDGQPQPNPCATQTQLPASARFLCAGGRQHAGESLCYIQCHHCEDTTFIRLQLKCDGTRWHTGGEVKGKLANGVGSQYPSHYLGTWCIQHYYQQQKLIRTPRLPVVDWTDAPADLNGLVRFAERGNLVSARVPSLFNWPLLVYEYSYNAHRTGTSIFNEL